MSAYAPDQEADKNDKFSKGLCAKFDIFCTKRHKKNRLIFLLKAPTLSGSLLLLWHSAESCQTLPPPGSSAQLQALFVMELVNTNITVCLTVPRGDRHIRRKTGAKEKRRRTRTQRESSSLGREESERGMFVKDATAADILLDLKHIERNCRDLPQC